MTTAREGQRAADPLELGERNPNSSSSAQPLWQQWLVGNWKQAAASGCSSASPGMYSATSYRKSECF